MRKNCSDSDVKLKLIVIFVINQRNEIKEIDNKPLP